MSLTKSAPAAPTKRKAAQTPSSYCSKYSVCQQPDAIYYTPHVAAFQHPAMARSAVVATRHRRAAGKISIRTELIEPTVGRSLRHCVRTASHRPGVAVTSLSASAFAASPSAFVRSRPQRVPNFTMTPLAVRRKGRCTCGRDDNVQHNDRLTNTRTVNPWGNSPVRRSDGGCLQFYVMTTS